MGEFTEADRMGWLVGLIVVCTMVLVFLLVVGFLIWRILSEYFRMMSEAT